MSLLIVEDEPSLREGLDNCLKALGQKQDQFGGGTGFNVETVGTAADARDRLRDAGRKEQPYDLLVLDLELPEHSKGRAVVEKGLDVFKLAKEEGSAREIVILSGQMEVMNRARRLGATNFVSKHDFKIKELETTVEERLWDSATVDAARVLERRIRELTPHAERSLVHHFGLCFSRCLQEVSRASDAIEDQLRERFGLDSKQDSGDFLIQQLRELSGAVEDGRQNWGKLQTSLGLGSLASPQPIDISDTFEDLRRRFRACFHAKNVAANIERLGPAKVLSFNGDVDAILAEIVLGGLAELPDSRENKFALAFSGELHEDWMVVTLRDNLVPLSLEDVTRINEGIGVHCTPRFSRAWGLSVMQHLALYGGGRLMVETAGEGNTIKYRIPRARND